MDPLNILIIGGGLGGPAAALFLARAGHRVTIVERHPVLRAGGTQVDLRHQGVEVANIMGIMPAVREKLVPEAGLSVVDQHNQTKVFWPGGEGSNADFFTQEVEIMRGDMVRVLYQATKEKVKYMFGMAVDSYEQDESSVRVVFSDKSRATYDVLIGADGLGSWTRRSMHLPGAENHIKSLRTWIAYWFVPRDATDTNVARAFYIPGRKMAMLRSAPGFQTQAYFGVKTDAEEMRSITRVPVEQQKAMWAELFKDQGWETKRMVSSLPAADDFYCTELAQVQSPAWSKGRVALVADAAHCPSAATGMGTTSAFVGAYVLAGEIASHPQDLETAFANYERVLRPYVIEMQRLPPMMDLFVPETSWGITFIHFAMSAMYRVMVIGSWLRLTALWERLYPDPKKNWRLPTYAALQVGK